MLARLQAPGVTGFPGIDPASPPPQHSRIHTDNPHVDITLKEFWNHLCDALETGEVSTLLKFSFGENVPVFRFALVGTMDDRCTEFAVESYFIRKSMSIKKDKANFWPILTLEKKICKSVLTVLLSNWGFVFHFK